MVDLDAVIRRARTATVRREAADAAVRELERSTSHREPIRARWPRWLVPAFTAAAAAVVAVVAAIAIGFALTSRSEPREVAAVRIGDRVAIVAEPGTVYHVVRAGGDDTTIEVERGEVTARLWPGPRAHRLTLQGGGVVALAKGTVYSLTVERGTGAVQVDEGTVEVRVGADVHRVPAGASWPADRPRTRRDRVPVLTALATPAAADPSPSAVATDPSPSNGGALAPSTSAVTATPFPSTASAAAPSISAASAATPSPSADSAAPSASNGRVPASNASPVGSAQSSSSRTVAPPSLPRTITAPDRAPAPLPRVTLEGTPPRRAGDDRKRVATWPTVKDRWRLARRLRSEGKLRSAIAECLAIADLRDATWSPIALVEAIRLYAGPLADPAHAIAIADRVIAEWPADVLVPEARQLRCRALARLGQECAALPAP